MYARIATHEGGDTERLRQMNEERMASGDLDLPDGVKRVMVLIGEGHRKFVTFFDSREAVAAAEPRFEAMGEEIPEEIRGKRTSVNVYEIVFDESF